MVLAVSLIDLQFDGLGGGLSRSVGNREGIRGGYFWPEVHTARMRGPDFARGGIEGNSFGVGDVVAKLCLLAAVNPRRRDIERTNGEFPAAKLLDGAAIVLTALHGLLFSVALFELASGFIACEQNEGDAQGHAYKKGS